MRKWDSEATGEATSQLETHKQRGKTEGVTSSLLIDGMDPSTSVPRASLCLLGRRLQPGVGSPSHPWHPQRWSGSLSQPCSSSGAEGRHDRLRASPSRAVRAQGLSEVSRVGMGWHLEPHGHGLKPTEGAEDGLLFVFASHHPILFLTSNKLLPIKFN